MTFIDRDNERHEVRGKVGDNVLYLAHRHGIEMEGGLLLTIMKKLYLLAIMNSK